MQKSLDKKRILAIGDSLALPGHGNKYEDTWIFKLKIKFPQYDFITFFKRQLTTDVLVTMGGAMELIKNQKVLIVWNFTIRILLFYSWA